MGPGGQGGWGNTQGAREVASWGLRGSLRALVPGGTLRYAGGGGPTPTPQVQWRDEAQPVGPLPPSAGDLQAPASCPLPALQLRAAGDQGQREPRVHTHTHTPLPAARAPRPPGAAGSRLQASPGAPDKRRARTSGGCGSRRGLTAAARDPRSPALRTQAACARLVLDEANTAAGTEEAVSLYQSVLAAKCRTTKNPKCQSAK